MRVDILRRKLTLRIKRKKRIRTKTSEYEDFPGISVFKSNRTLYTQAIGDVEAVTLAAVNGRKFGVRASKEDARKIAIKFTKVLKAGQIEQAVFDRNNYVYHGVIIALAGSLKENGIRL